MLSMQEESALKTYMTNMAKPSSTELLQLKDALLIQERPTSFRDGILRKEWLY